MPENWFSKTSVSCFFVRRLLLPAHHAKDAAIYWKYGCWFYEQTTRSQILIESEWHDAAGEADAGIIRFRAWGDNAESLIGPLLEALKKLPVDQPPEIKCTKTFSHHAESLSSASVTIRLVSPSGDDVPLSHSFTETGDKAEDAGLSQLQITARSELPPKNTPEIFISYAWGNNSTEDARQRTEVVDRLCHTLGQHDWHILRDSNLLRSGDLISGFMKRTGLADHVIVVLSDKYLRSPY